MRFDPEETVAALATPAGTGALGVIRVSGPKAAGIAEQVFRGKRKIADLKGYEAAYGHACRPDGTVLDEVIVLRFRAPKSYTGEDSVEFSCHGGPAVLESVLDALYEAGARPAGPGEFTRRALMNGKLSLTQAEGVGALIGADSRQAADLALTQREGRLNAVLEQTEEQLIDLQAHLAAVIDFPEEDVPEMTVTQLIDGAEQARGVLSELLDTYESGQILQNGIRTALLGPPNAGKSSLMNRLCGRKRSIVTDIPGTTRDLVESTVRLEELTLHLIDTAGLTDTEDPVEAEGVSMALEQLRSAQLVLLVLEAGRELPEEWMNLAEQKPTVLLWNKQDLRPGAVPPELAERFPLHLAVSAKTGEGLEQLTPLIRQAVSLHQLSGDTAALLNRRQKDAALRTERALEQAVRLLKEQGNFDLASACMDEALDELLSLSGKQVDETVIDRVFSTFCVGK